MINNALIEDYKALITQGRPAKFLIVLCHYIHLIKTKVYKQDIVVQRTAVSIDICLKYFEEQDNYATIDKDMSMLNVVFLIYYTFKVSNATSFNKWLQVIDLFKGQQLLYFISVLDSNRNLHFIIDPNTIKYTNFRQYLH